MTKLSESSHSLSEVHQSIDTTEKHGGWKRLFSFLGPAYLVSVGYMDPGNWATDLAGGSRFGYSLLWVLLMSNLMALLLQSLSARLGIVRGLDLAQANRETYPRFINIILYILAEIAIAACDLAEVLGMAIGLHLLTGIPLLWGVGFTILDTFLLLFLQNLGMRKMEAFIVALVIIIGGSFLVEILLAKPSITEVAGGLLPTIPNEEGLFIAIGIIGATVMPHNLYLHSALVQTRKIKKDDAGIRQALKFNLIDSTIALNAAFFVNAAILVLAATVFFKSGRHDVAEIKDAHQLLAPLLGSSLAPILFAVALIAAGQSSTITGTLAGQVIMEGYLHLRINPWVRRLLTRLIAILPALIVIYWFGDSEVDKMLVLSQVILSLQLSFAIIPLIHFVSNKEKMGAFAIKPFTQVISWLVALILVYLNIRMVIEQALLFFHHSDSMVWKIVIIAAIIIFFVLLIVTTIYPLLRKQALTSSADLHSEKSTAMINPLRFSSIAIALDFGKDDARLLSYALTQSNHDSEFLLIHVVESANSKILGTDADDFETRRDKERLEGYVKIFEEHGHKASAHLGFKRRVDSIVQIVSDKKADLLIMGAHRHTGIKDYIYGETVDQVRHKVNIPVLIVNL
jgi:manganese transport protein